MFVIPCKEGCAFGQFLGSSPCVRLHRLLPPHACLRQLLGSLVHTYISSSTLVGCSPFSRSVLV